MKNILLILILIASTLYSCSKDKKVSSLVGKWELIEQLADPGDGSGVFTAIESDKTLEFFEDGKVESNGNLCFMTADTKLSTVAKFNDETKKIFNTDCIDDFELTYEFDGENLILHYICIEACGHKYEKVN